MTPRDFCYWLQGFLEINNPMTIDPIELDIIRDHLKLVFQKETPDRRYSVTDLNKMMKEYPVCGDGIIPFDSSPQFTGFLNSGNSVPISC